MGTEEVFMGRKIRRSWLTDDQWDKSRLTLFCQTLVNERLGATEKLWLAWYTPAQKFAWEMLDRFRAAGVEDPFDAACRVTVRFIRSHYHRDKWPDIYALGGGQVR